MNVRHDDDFKIALNFLGEGGTPLNNSKVKFEFIYKDCEGNQCKVSFDGTTRLNNVVKDNRVIAIFEDNTFQRGQLSELTEEDIKIATDKNWQVIGV